MVKVNKCSLDNFYLEEETANAYEKMCLDSINKGLNISITSAYRSYNEQEKLYNSYLKLYGKNYVDKYVALPGHSEHQTGLAIDLESLEYDIFKNSKEYLWIKENAYKYGFIIRYQKGKEKITGYGAEEWHIRYVGKNAAEYIYKNNITFEEYYDLFLNNKSIIYRVDVKSTLLCYNDVDLKVIIFQKYIVNGYNDKKKINCLSLFYLLFLQTFIK